MDRDYRKCWGWYWRRVNPVLKWFFMKLYNSKVLNYSVGSRWRVMVMERFDGGGGGGKGRSLSVSKVDTGVTWLRIEYVFVIYWPSFFTSSNLITFINTDWVLNSFKIIDL